MDANDKAKKILQRLKMSLFKSVRAFIIVYGSRQGIALVLDFIKRKPLQLLYHKSALSSALFASWYTFIYTVFRNKESKRVTYLAGFLAGIGITFESKENRIAITQQTSVRSLNGLYQVLQNVGLCKIPFLYEAMFSLSSASIMYSFVLHPDTLPPSLVKFMKNISNTPTRILKLIRDVLNRTPQDLIMLQRWIISKRGSASSIKELHQLILSEPDARKAIIDKIPIKVQHYTMDSSFMYIVWLFKRTFKQIIPVYLGLHVIPRFFLNFKSFAKNPLQSFFGAIRSSIFLSVFVSSFEVFLVLSRRLLSSDYKALPFVHGLMAATMAIFVEEPKRRPELALYVVSKAIHSFYQVIVKYPRLRHMDTFLFSSSTGLLMILFEFYPSSLTKMFLTVLNRFLVK